jgi:hypothetical protein
MIIMASKTSTLTYQGKQEAGVVRERKATVIDRELKKIYKRDGTVLAIPLLDAARDPKHPLHHYFEWDDTVAAEKYRIDQAMRMIMTSKFVVMLNKSPRGVSDLHTRPALVRQFIPAFRGEGFKMRNEVLNDVEQRAAFVARKKEALRAWCASVIDIKEFDTMRGLILAEIGGD